MNNIGIKKYKTFGTLAYQMENYLFSAVVKLHLHNYRLNDTQDFKRKDLFNFFKLLFTLNKVCNRKLSDYKLTYIDHLTSLPRQNIFVNQRIDEASSVVCHCMCLRVSCYCIRHVSNSISLLTENCSRPLVYGTLGLITKH